jgi:hypothetical protein
MATTEITPSAELDGETLELCFQTAGVWELGSAGTAISRGHR